MAPDAISSLDFLPSSSDMALEKIAEPVRLWFRRQWGVPTPAQRLAWPALAWGDNLLLSSPTGSGKTLAAFAPILGNLLTGGPLVTTKCLYLAPMKALAGDIRRNLRRYLKGIRTFLPPEAPVIRVGLRTGDTSARRRRQLLQHPPAILITTPESLAVMLAQANIVDFFTDLRWVIVDEVHALAGNKRGADLALSLERLEAHLGRIRGQAIPLQRIGLSATCAPLETVARFLVGSHRPCRIAEVADSRPLDLHIEPLPPPDPDRFAAKPFLKRLLARLEPELSSNRATLVFTNVRSLAERLTWALRQRYPELAGRIAVHHSSLAPARRRQVERRLKQGRLRVVVSSTSLELGIDIGGVDGVVLVHPPGGVVRLLQRVGRAGHGPHLPRKGLVLTDNPAALLEAAVTAASSHSAQVEPMQVPEQPLDVLCQHLLGLAMHGWQSAEETFRLVTRAYPYCNLSREDFEACLTYLCGRHADGRDWLLPRLLRENDDFIIADERTARLVPRNLGTIVAEEPCAIRLQRDMGPENVSDLGEVDELFADGLQVGDRFLLDGRCLEYRRREGLALVVSEVLGRPRVPRWTGQGWPLSPDLAGRLYIFRVRAAEALRDGPDHLALLLGREYGLESAAVRELVDLFTLQETISEIPDQHSLLIEWLATDQGQDYYLHTPLNRAGNEALARVLAGRLARDRDLRVIALAADLGLLLSIRSFREITANNWRELLSPEGFETDLARAIEESLALRERFRQAALIGLMLLRKPLGRRRRVGGRDWAQRCLFDQVAAADPEFVLLRQARRDMVATCDAPAARAFLQELSAKFIRIRRLTQVSPLARHWTQGADQEWRSTSVLERLKA